MEPYKAKELPFEYEFTPELIKLIGDVHESYGEYKSFLKNMSYDYKSFLELAFINDIYYSFKIDGTKITKDNMFHIPYMNKSNEVIEFSNIRKSLLIGMNDVNNGEINLSTFNKINKSLYESCKKDNHTKASGKLRKIQNFLLKPGLAGSSVSFVPPIYSELPQLMNNLSNYILNNIDECFISTAIAHYQFEKIHPYVSGNGKLGRLMIPIQFAFYKHEPPLLFISESLDALKNTYFTLLSGEINEDINGFIKFILQAIIEQCNSNIKKIRKLNKIYKNDVEEFKNTIGGTTINKVYPIILRKIVFTTNDIVEEGKIHINSVNKVLNKLVEQGYLIKEKKKGTNRVTFCYKSMYDIFMN